MAGIILNPSEGSHKITKIECGSSSPYLGGSVNLSQFIFLQEFDGGDNNLLSVTGTNGLTNLIKFQIKGANTVDLNVSSLPANLIDFNVEGNNLVNGTVGNLPTSLKSILLLGQNALSGNIEDFPSGLLYINVTGQNSIGGQLDMLNCPLCKYINIAGKNTIGGTINNLPPTLEYLFISGGLNGSGNTTTGDIGNLPPTLKTYRNGTSGNVSGNLINLPDGLEIFSMSVNNTNTTTGDINDLPSSLVFYNNGGNNSTFGNLRNLPPGIRYYSNTGRNTATEYYDGTVTGAGQKSWAPNMQFFTVLPFTLGMTQQELVTLLIDLSLTSWDSSFSGKKVQINGPNNPTVNLTLYPSAQTAITNLQSKGVQVLVNTTT